MTIQEGCVFGFSVDRLLGSLSSQTAGRSLSQSLVDVLDICRKCEHRECPGIGRMMTDELENGATAMPLAAIPVVKPQPPDLAPFEVPAPSYRWARKASAEEVETFADAAM